MRYRRARTKGGVYFFTVVTFKREKILLQPENVSLLRESFRSVMERHPFKINAFVLLPEHFHCIWTLPDGDRDFSKRWRLIKSNFTRNYDDKHAPKESRIRKNKQAVWQRRFWEHLIRDENDFAKHVEYIHYNPVKHGFVKAPEDWEYSSFNKFVHNRKYDRKWGAGENITFQDTIGKE